MTYPYTDMDIAVNDNIRKRIGEKSVTDLAAAMNEIIAANVRTLRELLGLNQPEFADELKVAQASVSRWENGGEPRSKYLARLAGMAGVSETLFRTQLLTGIRATPRNLATVYLPVHLPSEVELAAMFSAILEGLKNEKNQDVIALRLAQRLPVALAQTVARSSSLQGDPSISSSSNDDLAPKQENP